MLEMQKITILPDEKAYSSYVDNFCRNLNQNKYSTFGVEHSAMASGRATVNKLHLVGPL